MGRFHSKTLRMFSHPHIIELIWHQLFPRSLVEILCGVSHDNYVLLFFSFKAKVNSWGKAVVEKAAQGKQNFSVIMWSSCSLCIKIYKVS